MSRYVFINDGYVEEAKAQLHFRDLSVMRGYGVFDFFKVINFQPVLLDAHLNRFYFSAAEMHLSVAIPKEELKQIITGFIQKNDIKTAGIRITLTGGYSEDGYSIENPNLVISQHKFMSPTSEQFQKGIRLKTVAHQRQLAHVKTIDYVMAIWLQPLLKQFGADDALYCNDDMITECPRSNIFIITKENKLVTPADKILKGITRNKVAEIASTMMEVEEREITLNELEAASEIFITSTTKNILPVRSIDEYHFAVAGNYTYKIFNMLMLSCEK